MAMMPPGSRAHFIFAPAFINGVGARLFSIDNVINPLTRQHQYRYTHWVRDAEATKSPAVRIGLAGTGGLYLNSLNTQWSRRLLDLANRCDREKVSPEAVADHLAALSFDVHEVLTARGDTTVGPRSIVAWRGRPGTPRAGGGHAMYTGTDLDRSTTQLPTISNGMDVSAIVEVTMQATTWGRLGPTLLPPEFDEDEVSRLIALRDWDPDERLR